MARGGKRPGAGRKPGSSTKINARQRRTLTEIARDHTEQALGVLTSIMCDTDAPAAARATAANSLLDRGWSGRRRTIVMGARRAVRSRQSTSPS